MNVLNDFILLLLSFNACYFASTSFYAYPMFLLRRAVSLFTFPPLTFSQHIKLPVRRRAVMIVSNEVISVFDNCVLGSYDWFTHFK